MNKSFWVGMGLGMLSVSLIAIALPLFPGDQSIPYRLQYSARHFFTIPECYAGNSKTDWFLSPSEIHRIVDNNKSWCAERFQMNSQSVTACEEGMTHIADIARDHAYVWTCTLVH